MNARGFTLIEMLMALGMVMVTVLGISAFSTTWKRNFGTADATYMSVALEAALLTSMVDPKYYPPAVKDQLANDIVPNFTFELPGPNDKDVSVPLATPTFISRNFETCTGFTDSNCMARVEVRAAVTEDNAGYPANYGFAYKIDMNPQYNVPSRSSIKNYAGDPWANLENYAVAIPNILYKTNEASACNPNQHIGIRGVRRDSGQVTCIEKTSAGGACPPGTYPIGLKIVGANELGFACSAPTPVPKCADNYSVSSFNPLDAAQGTVTGSCTLATVDVSNGPPGQPLIYGALGSNNITGKFCPPNYHAQANCVIVTVNSQNGFCPATCYTDPDDLTTAYDCSTTPAPNQGAINSWVAGRRAFCTYTPAAAQPCGAVFVGYPRITVSCVSNLGAAGAIQ